MKRIIINLFFIAILVIPAIGAVEAYGAALLDKVVATVNEEVITWSELMRTIALDAREFLAGVPADMRKEKIKELERPLLNNMIEVKLQLQQAAHFGLSVSDSDIDVAVDEIQKKFNLSDDALMKSLSAENLTMRDYRSRMKEQILIQKVVNFAVKSNIVITNKEIEEYFEKNKMKYSSKEKIRIRQILFSGSDESSKSDAEAKAADVMKRLDKGGDFAELAKEISEGPNKDSGGDLGYIGVGTVLKEIDDAAALLKPGEISRPFWSPAGMHVIKLEDRTGKASLDKVRDSIKELLVKQAFSEKYEEWVTGLRETAHVEIKL